MASFRKQTTMNKSIILKEMKRILIIKVIFILLSAHLLFSPLFGHPVWGEKVILTQPNGTKIVGYIYGDEFHRRIETEEGYTMILNEEAGTIEYALLENNKLVPSGMVVGVVRVSYLEQINFPKHLSDRKYRIAEIRQKSPERLHELTPWSQKEIKIQSLGITKKVFVVCVQFQSETSPPTEWSTGEFSPSGFDGRLFSTDSADISMTNYYKSNSYNKFWPDGYTYPNWITLPQTASWYKDSGSWKQIIIDAMDGIRTINSSFDFTQYATNGDMDMILVWAGRRMNWSEFYWPHMSQPSVNRYGVRIKYYNAVNEKNSDGSENTTISVFCHEYGHMTGSPDLYDYSSFHLKPVGAYCIMGYDSYKTNFCGYIKWRVYGWITPEEVFSSGTYSVNALALDLASISNPTLYKINIESPDEYLLLENRFNGTDSNYENLSGRSNGLLITHIDENYPAGQGMPDYPFYGVEAIVPGLDPSITTLGEYAAYYDEMVFASDHGYTSLGPASPDDKAPGAYLTLTTGDDTEHVIYRNTQGHSSSSGIDISDISYAGQTMNFTVTVPSTSPAISGSVKTPAGQGIEGVTLSFSDGGGETTTEDADGNYNQSVSSGWSGTVIPTKAGYIFDPLSQSYSTVTSSQLDQDYFASISFIKGNVANSVGAGIEDVWIAAYSSTAGPLTFNFTDSNGDYVVGGLNTGSYKLRFDTRYASGMYAVEWYNDKDSRGAGDLVTVTEGSSTSDINAVLAAGGGGIEGRVTNSAGAGIQSIIAFAYTLAGGRVSYDFTDSNGDYEIKSIKSGNYKMYFYTGSASGDYISEWYNDKDSLGTGDLVSITEGSTTSIDAELATITPKISGEVKNYAGTGIQGVTITFSNGGGTATTDSSGGYFHSVSDGYSGTATPAKTGYTFSPTSIDYINVTSDKKVQDYIATILTYTISGNVGEAGAPIAAGLNGVVMDGLPGDPATDDSGNYTATADHGFSGTVTPTKAGYSFSPSSRVYTNVTSHQPDQNYTASIIQHTLIIAVGSRGGGTTNPTAGSYTHDYGTQVQVTATPDSGYQFSSWAGGASGTTNPITITMDADKTIIANFASTSSGNGDGEKKACFIATAAYGSPLHPHLDILRDFRDKYLMPNGFGRRLVKLYYRYSPGIANFIAEHKVLKAAVRVNLIPVIAFSSLMVHFGPVATAVVLVFMLVFPILFMRFYPGRVRVL